MKKPRYSVLFFLEKKIMVVISIEKYGYATSLNYENRLIYQIEKYFLWKWDKETSKRIEKSMKEKNG